MAVQVSLLNPGKETPYPTENWLQIEIRDEPDQDIIQHWPRILECVRALSVMGTDSMLCVCSDGLIKPRRAFQMLEC